MFGTALVACSGQIIAEAEWVVLCGVTAVHQYSLRSHLPSFTTSVRGETRALVVVGGHYSLDIMYGT